MAQQAFTSRSLANHALFRERNNHVVQRGGIILFRLLLFPACTLPFPGFCLFCFLLSAFCMRMRQYGLCFCLGTCCLRSTLVFADLFAGCFLELNDLYWVLRSTNVFFKVSRHFYDESEFIVASLSPLRGQSFIS